MPSLTPIRNMALDRRWLGSRFDMGDHGKSQATLRRCLQARSARSSSSVCIHVLSIFVLFVWPICWSNLRASQSSDMLWHALTANDTYMNFLQCSIVPSYRSCLGLAQCNPASFLPRAGCCSWGRHVCNSAKTRKEVGQSISYGRHGNDCNASPDAPILCEVRAKGCAGLKHRCLHSFDRDKVPLGKTANAPRERRFVATTWHLGASTPDQWC